MLPYLVTLAESILIAIVCIIIFSYGMEDLQIKKEVRYVPFNEWCTIALVAILFIWQIYKMQAILKMLL